LREAELLLANSGFDGAVSRASYAVFHAVTAVFALEERTFARHSALAAAVHRDLVKSGRWSTALGRDFSFCLDLRAVSDYGSDVRIDATQAADAIEAARRILLAVERMLPEDFSPVPVRRA
jgi:uncharacterized protein